MKFLKSARFAKLVFFILAIYGVLSIVLSTFWIWTMYRPPSIGYLYAPAVDSLPEAIDGKAHIMKKEFYGHAWWATVLTHLGGLILFTCHCIRNKYTSHGYFFYVLTAVFNCLFIFTLTVFYLMLALGSKGLLDWKYENWESKSEFRPSIQCGIAEDFKAMYGSVYDPDEALAEAERVSRRGLSPKELKSYHTCTKMGAIEARAQENRVLGVSIFMILFGIFSLLITIVTIPVAWQAWKLSLARNFNAQSKHQTSLPPAATDLNTEPQFSNRHLPAVQDQPTFPNPPNPRSMTGQPIVTSSE